MEVSKMTEFEVKTWNEDGWSEGHEEEDITDDLQIALIWLTRDDCRDGSIYADGELVATKDYYGEPVEFHNGWTKNGKVE